MKNSFFGNGRNFAKIQLRMLGMAKKILKSMQDAEDCVQDVLVKFHEKYGEVKLENGHLTSLLVTMSKNLAIDMYRMRKSEKNSTNFASGDSTNISIANLDSVNDEVRHGVRKNLKAFGSIHPNDEILIRLKYLHDCSHKEIGDYLNISTENSKVRFMRAKSKFEKFVNENGGIR